MEERVILVLVFPIQACRAGRYYDVCCLTKLKRLSCNVNFLQRRLCRSGFPAADLTPPHPIPTHTLPLY